MKGTGFFTGLVVGIVATVLLSQWTMSAASKEAGTAPCLPAEMVADYVHSVIQRGMDGFEVGNVMTQSFREVWQAPAHKAMVDGIDVSKCPRCRYDHGNRLIEAVFMGADKMHSNFL